MTAVKTEAVPQLLRVDRGCEIYADDCPVKLQPIIHKASGFSTSGLLGYRVLACQAAVWRFLILPNCCPLDQDATIVRESDLIDNLVLRGWAVEVSPAKEINIGWGNFNHQDY